MGTAIKGLLERAEAIRLRFGPDREAERFELLGALVRAGIKSPADLTRLHELLSFARAWPDSPRIHDLAESGLERFEERADLGRFRARLANSGIAGTESSYRFYHPTARWLTRRWPGCVTIDWDQFENHDALLAALRHAGVFAERQGLAGYGYDAREMIEAMRGAEETDAAFLLAAFDALELGARERESRYDALELPLRISPGDGAPSRTSAALSVRDLEHQRQDFEKPGAARSAIFRPAEAIPLERLERRRARRVVDLARLSLAVRLRDLDAFAYADSRDLQLADCGRGFQIAILGVTPERRFLLECEHGFLMLQNGVPIGYGCTWALFGSCQLNFNLFPTFRGANAAWLYQRVCAVFHGIYRCDTFVVEPYQLGYDNDEAIESGAWWFYAKLGFRPRESSALRLARSELAKKKRNRKYRTPEGTLRRLAQQPMFLTSGTGRRDVLGALEPAAVGLAVADFMARRYGSERPRGVRACRRRIVEQLEIDPAKLTREQRLWIERWSPMLAALGDVSKWPRRDRVQLSEVVVAKGAIEQEHYVPLFDRHRRLRRGLIELMSD